MGQQCSTSAVVQHSEKAMSGEVRGCQGSIGFSNEMINRQPHDNKKGNNPFLATLISRGGVLFVLIKRPFCTRGMEQVVVG